MKYVAHCPIVFNSRAKLSQRVLVTTWKPDPAQFTWSTVCILAMLERGSWNELRKTLGQRTKEEGILPYGTEELI